MPSPTASSGQFSLANSPSHLSRQISSQSFNQYNPVSVVNDVQHLLSVHTVHCTLHSQCLQIHRQLALALALLSQSMPLQDCLMPGRLQTVNCT